MEESKEKWLTRECKTAKDVIDILCEMYDSLKEERDRAAEMCVYVGFNIFEKITLKKMLFKNIRNTLAGQVDDDGNLYDEAQVLVYDNDNKPNLMTVTRCQGGKLYVYDPGIGEMCVSLSDIGFGESIKLVEQLKILEQEGAMAAETDK